MTSTTHRLETKACTRCTQEKPLHEFAPDSRRRDGRQSQCRPCGRIQQSAYHARRKTGEVRPRLIQLSEAADPVEFLRPRIKVDEDTSCWRWLMGARNRGYPQMSVNGRMVLAHRWSYENVGGHTIPEGWEVDHQGCPNTLCVNPVHLQAVSPEEHREVTNQRRAELQAAGPGWGWVPPTRPRNLLELSATLRLDDGRAAPTGAGIIRRSEHSA